MKKFLLIIIIITGFLLRFHKLDQIPQGFSWDEASVGYNGYSLLKTGKDEFAKPWPILIESFGDYKTALYSWILPPFIKLFGLNIFAVRFPNVIFGTLLIPAFYFLGSKIFKNNWQSLILSALASFSPWLIHFSRYTVEWFWGFLFFILGLSFLIEAQQKNKNYPLLLSSLLFSLSLYSYHSFRFFIPLLIFTYFILYHKQLRKNKKIIILSTLLFVIVLFPLINSFRKSDWLSRAQGVSLFSNENCKNLFTEGMYRHTVADLPLKHLFNNKLIFYGKEVLDRWLAHFSPQFLFLGVDVTPRIEIKGVGKLHLFSLPFLLLGITKTFNSKDKLDKFFLVWLFLAPIPSSLTYNSPHGLRSLILLPPLFIFITKGIFSACKNFSKKKLFTFTISSLYLISVIYFLWQYFLFYPEDTAKHWQAGCKQMVDKLNIHKKDYQNIIISTHYGQPHIFIAFFTPIKPADYQKMVFGQEKIFNSRISTLGNMTFKKVEKKDFCRKNTLIITAPNFVNNKVPRLDKAVIANRFHQPKTAFEFFTTNQIEVSDLCPEKN